MPTPGRGGAGNIEYAQSVAQTQAKGKARLPARTPSTATIDIEAQKPTAATAATTTTTTTTAAEPTATEIAALQVHRESKAGATMGRGLVSYLLVFPDFRFRFYIAVLYFPDRWVMNEC